MTKGAEMTLEQETDYTLEQLYAHADEVHDWNNLKPPAELVVLTSGDNYYCVNNENGKVYYWSSSEDSYYYIAESIDEFASFFR